MLLFFMASSARYRSSRETSEVTCFRRRSLLSLPSGRSIDPGGADGAEAAGRLRELMVFEILQFGSARTRALRTMQMNE